MHVPHGSSRAGVGRPRGRRPPGRSSRSDQWVEPRTVDGVLVGEATFTLPEDLPLGWHRLHARFDDLGEGGEADRARWSSRPHGSSCRPPCASSRAWGFMTQLYSVRSRPLVGPRRPRRPGRPGRLERARTHGAGFVLVNPLHAAEPVPPMEPSPYLPTTRRFVNPIYLRVEDIPRGRGTAVDRPRRGRAAGRRRCAALNRARDAARPRRRLDGQARGARAGLTQPRVARPPGAASRRSARARARGCVDFATWCALAERYGLPTVDLARRAARPTLRGGAGAPRGAVRPGRLPLWLQWCLDEQLAAAQRTARDGGHGASGVVHDLAVGVHPERRRHLGAARTSSRRGVHGRRPAGRVQPAGPGLEPAAVATRPARRARLRAVPRHDPRACCGTPAACGSTTSSGCSGCGGCPSGLRRRRGHLRPLRPRGDDRHPRARGAPRRRGRRRRGPRHGRAVGARLPARARDPRHLDPVVRARLGRRAARCRPERVARAVPGDGDHARPAADRRLPGRRARRAARPARPAHPLGRGGAREPTDGPRRACSASCASAGLLADDADVERDTVEALHRYLARTPGQAARASPSPTPSATGGPSTSRARTTSTPTGGCRCRTASGSRCCSRT